MRVLPEQYVKRISPLSIAVSVALGLTLSAPVSAQEEQSEDESTVEVITVKSERRIKRVQDIPTSMTALSEKNLEKKAVSRLDDLAFASPGLTISDAGLTQSVNIRGIGLASTEPSVSNGVGTYIDGLFQPPIISTLNFFDVEYVQVLRGPQGTFAGSNSTGGAIMINSRRPDIDAGVEGNIELGIGNYAAKKVKGAINLPVAETLAARVAVNYNDRDSFYDSVGSEPTTAGSLDEKSARVGLLWAPTDDLELYVKYEMSDKSTGGFAARPIPGTPFAAGRTDDPRKLAYNTNTASDESADTLLIDISYELANGIQLKWLTGDQTKEINNLYDYDATELEVTTRDQFVKEEQISHEFNIVSKDGVDLTWVAGAYYQKNDVTVDIENGPFPLNIFAKTEKTTKGVFGQVGYQLTDDLQVEMGLRKAWAKAWNDPIGSVVVGRGVVSEEGIKVASITGEYEDDDLLGKVSVNYSLSRDHNLYAYVARGYKPGGINSATSTFDQETVLSTEAGWKGRLLDGNLSGSVAIFNSDYKDFQYSNIDITTGRSQVSNIAEATIRGIEVAFNAYIGSFTVDFAASLIDSELNPTQPIVNTRESGSPSLPQCTNGQDPADGQCFDFMPFIVDVSDGSNLYAPDSSFTVGAEYEFELSNGAYLIPRLNYAWIDDQWTSLLYDEDTDLLESRGLLSATITYLQDDWKVQLWGRNLADKLYISGQQLDNNTEFYGAPRTIGLDVSYQF